MSREQVLWAAGHGFADVALDPATLLDHERAGAERAAVAGKARQALAAERSVILHSCLGPQDPRLGKYCARNTLVFR